jgi:hypothetical protein
MKFPAIIHVACPECGMMLTHNRDDKEHYMIHPKLPNAVCSLVGKTFKAVQVEMKERST